MALTRPRAYQIYDIDYKQATRVITVSNITLSGGAPSQVDGVSLTLKDRVLVTGQTNKAQNGIYYVTTVGSGSNGTWSRSIDTDTTGELLAGTIVMVTEGVINADSQWKLTTDDPIVIGVSELIFEQNSAFAFGNVYANGTAVLASSVGDVLTLSAGNNIAITGNNTSKTVTIGVTGISLNSISNGTSNVNVVSSGGNVTVGINGTSNVAVFGSGGANITGTLGVTGNITGGNLSGTSISGTLTTASQPNITSVGTLGSLTVTGNVTGGNLKTASVTIGNGPISGLTTISASGNANVGNLGTAGQIIAVGNISGGNILGNGAGLTGINTFSNVTVTGGNSAVADSIADTLTFTAGAGIAIVVDSATDTITIATSGGSEIFVDGADFGTVTELVTLSDDLGLVTEAVEAESDLGSIVTSGVFYPDLLVVEDPVDFILGGGSNGQYLGTYGNGTIFWQSLSSAPLTGDMVGNINGNTFSITGLGTLTSTTISASGNITGGNILGGANVNATTHTGATVNVTGNIDGGNLRTSGLITATGSATAGSFNTSGTIGATGNITGGNLTVGAGTITGGNLTVGTGTITGGNIVNSNANGVGNIGSSTTYFNTVFAKATSAQYADLAENYAADAEYPPGTVVVFGGDNEVTISSKSNDHCVAGVISTAPSYLMNSGLNAKYVATVALTGRVPTKVLGPVTKGDLMVSAPNGYAQACNHPTVGTVVGKSLENFSDLKGVIEIVVGVR